MTPATTWTEQSGAAPIFLEGVSLSAPYVMLFGVFLMPGSGLIEPAPVSYSEMSLSSATVQTEMTTSQTVWTEMT